MKVHVVVFATAMVVACGGTACADNVTINAISASGVGKVVGTIGISDASEGLVIMPDLSELPPGDHGFHIHVNPDCGPGAGPDGQPAAGLGGGGRADMGGNGQKPRPHRPRPQRHLPPRGGPSGGT